MDTITWYEIVYSVIIPILIMYEYFSDSMEKEEYICFIAMSVSHIYSTTKKIEREFREFRERVN